MDDNGSIPPPYALSDPLLLSPSHGRVEVRAHRRLPPREQDAPSYGHVAQSVTDSDFSSAADYFEDNQPSQICGGRNVARHSLTFNQSTKRDELHSIPVCWLVGDSDLTDLDMMTFSNYLFPIPTNSKQSQSSSAKVQDFETEYEPWTTRKTRMTSVVAEWNEGFFSLRGLYLDLDFDDSANSTPTTWCSSCRAATQDVKAPLSPGLTAAAAPISTKPTASAQIKRAAGLFAQHVVNHVEQQYQAQANRNQGQGRGRGCCSARSSRGIYSHNQGPLGHLFSQSSQLSNPSKPSPPHAALNPVAHLLKNLSLQQHHPAKMSGADRADLRGDLKDMRRELKSAVSEIRVQKRAEGREARDARRYAGGRKRCYGKKAAPVGAPLGMALPVSGDDEKSGLGVQPLGWQRGERRELRTVRREGLREIRGARRELRKEERSARRGKCGQRGWESDGESEGDKI